MNCLGKIPFMGSGWAPKFRFPSQGHEKPGGSDRVVELQLFFTMQLSFDPDSGNQYTKLIDNGTHRMSVEPVILFHSFHDL